MRVSGGAFQEARAPVATADVGPAPPEAAGGGSVLLLGALIACGALALFLLAPALGGVFAVLGVACLWRHAAPRARTAAKADAPPLSRLAATSTLVGVLATGFAFTADMLLPSAGLLGIALGLVALRRIRSREGRLRGNGYGYVGVVVGVMHLCLFALLFREAQGLGFTNVA